MTKLNMSCRVDSMKLITFSSLKNSSFFKSMILLNFPIQWYLNILNLFNISMILNKWIIQWFSFDVTEVEMIIRVQREIQGETDQVQEMKDSN